VQPVSIELRNVTKVFGGNVKAVDDVSLTLEPGHLVTLLGPSGSGKTTILRAIAGFEEITSGEILVAGNRIENVPTHRRQLGMVAQDYALFPHMTVHDNLRFGITTSRRARRETARISPVEMNNRIGSMLELVGLDGYGSRRPQQLSGGQKQRVALARALVTEPRVLLLDEPFAALDKHLREQLQLEVRRVQQQVGITTVFVTHDQGEALSMSDRIAVLRDGKVEHYGTPSEVYDHPLTSFVAGFVGRTNILHGEVAGVRNGLVEVGLEGAQIDVSSDQSGLSVGDRISVLVRPEQITIENAGVPAGSENRILGTILKSVYFGDRFDVTVQTSAGVVVANIMRRSATYHGLEPGESVWIAFHPSAIALAPGS